MVQLGCCQTVEKENQKQVDHKTIKMQEEYNWSPSADAPEEYPIEVIKGYFYKGEELAFVPNHSVMNTGWGSVGKQIRGTSIIPEGLNITFLSLVENKFYRGEFKLPEKEISDYFQKGYINYDTRKKESYHDMNIGIAPGGVVVVWLAGSKGEQVEIGRYQAVETKVDMEEVNPGGTKDQNEYVSKLIASRKEVVENIKENGIKFGLHETYRIKYSWRPKVILPEGCKINRIGLEMFNAEAEQLFDERLSKNEFKNRAIPKEIDVSWLDAKGKEQGGEISLDWNENETFEAFKQIYKKDKGANAELVIKFVQDKKLDAFKVYLRTEKEEFELEDTHNGAYSIED